MVVLSPIWLLGLIPLLAMAVWLLLGQRQRVHVPFLPLWRGPVSGPRTRRSLQPPPVAIALAVLSILLAVLAAARVEFGSAGQANVRVLVDHGMSMSAHGPHGLRFQEAAEALVSALRQRFSQCSVDVFPIPGAEPRHVDLAELPSITERLDPTAQDTRGLLDGELSGLLQESSGPVVVITDQKLSDTDRRIVQVPPESAVRDVGIVQISARERPAPQVMVRVRNQSPLTQVNLVVSSGGQQVRAQLQLPRPGGEQNYFFDLPEIGPMISAQLDVQDDIEADDRAWLVREGNSPHIEPHSPVPPELQRMIEVYERTRPASDASSRVLVVRDSSELPSQTPAVVLQAPSETLPDTTPVSALHAVTQHVNWERLSGPLLTAGNPAAGWTPLVWSGSHVLVAARSAPSRQVWVGFDAPRWAATTDYVIFWTNVFDWEGGGGQMLGAHSINEWSAEWKPADSSNGTVRPGLYRRSDGAWRAFNPTDEPTGAPPRIDWRSRLKELTSNPGRHDLTVLLLAAAVACLLLAAGTWKRAAEAAARVGLPSGAGPVTA